MPPIIFYKCSKCKKVCGTYEDADRCERSHLSAVSVKELEYRIGAYPYRISLMFSDGKEQDYVVDDGFYLMGQTKQEVKYENDKDKSDSNRDKSP